MNRKEAIMWQEKISRDYSNRIPKILRDGIEQSTSIAIKAIESMPEYKKLKERDRAMMVREVHLDEYYCPKCGAENGCCDGKVEDNFCPRCGQRIDWSEEEEYEK